MAASTRSRAEVEAEIKETLDLVPSFFNRIPDRLLDHERVISKDLELGETLILNKYKELMGVALHAETKGRYRTLFHTEAAKLFRASFRGLNLIAAGLLAVPLAVIVLHRAEPAQYRTTAG